MYLSFYIWGWVQVLFGQGLFAARYFAIFLGILALVGMWIVSRRMGNRWLATLAVWVIALNPTLISIYSRAISQVIIICMITWVFVCVLGEKRATWQIVFSSVLAAFIVLTRENMVFILPLLILYIFWQHGRKNGFLALAAILIVISVGHIIYWPDIMRLWTKWLPDNFLPSLDLYSQLDLGNSTTRVKLGLSIFSRLLSLSQSLRIYLIPIIGSLITLVLWPKLNSWRTRSHYRAAIFLAVLFFVLLISHATASIGQNYCVFCFENYIAFFGNVGLLLIVISIDALNKKPAIYQGLGIFTSILLATSAIGFSLFEYIGDFLLTLPVPRFRYGRILPGKATLWQLLNNKFHITYVDARQYTPAVVGFACGILLLVILLLIYLRFFRGKKLNFISFCSYGFLIFGLILNPLLTFPIAKPLCRNNVIVSYEQIGSQLAEIAPPGSKIYIDGSRTAIPLLYVRDVEILFPQLNDHYNYRIGGDPDMVLRKGYWNEEIAETWRNSADVFVIEANRISNWGEYLNDADFEKIINSNNPFSCSNISEDIYLFKRK